MKTDHMILRNKEESAAKTEAAIACINDMVRNDEQVAVCELVRRTGLSRAFFYNNENVNRELERARELQRGKPFISLQKVAIDRSLKCKIEMMEKKLLKKDEVIASLEEEVTRLKKIADAKTLSIVQGL